MHTIPQLAFLYSSLIASMLLGASIVHAVLRPDLSLPPREPPPSSSPAAAQGAAPNKADGPLDAPVGDKLR
jgi:hypothetical protein